MKTTKEMIEVMQACERGEQIEFCYTDEVIKVWQDTNGKPLWNWGDTDYRVKPKPKYVPFDTAEEFFAAQRKHGRDIIACGELYANSYIDCYCNVFLYKSDNTDNWTLNFEKLLENCTFADGTPCGKEVAK